MLDLKENPVSRYVVAVRRERRDEGVSADLVRAAPGVTVLGVSKRGRLVIDVDNTAVAEIVRRFSDRLIIEPEILHSTL